MKNIVLIALFVVIFIVWVVYYNNQSQSTGPKSLQDRLMNHPYSKQGLTIIKVDSLDCKFTTINDDSQTIDAYIGDDIILSVNDPTGKEWTLTNQTHPMKLLFVKSELLTIEHVINGNRKNFYSKANQSGFSKITLVSKDDKIHDISIQIF